jgi:hypothetical protein
MAGNRVIEASERFEVMAKSRTKRAKQAPADLTAYQPQFRRPPVMRERPVTGYLDSTMRAAFDEYLTRKHLTMSECLRWLISDAVANDRDPPGFAEREE